MLTMISWGTLFVNVQTEFSAVDLGQWKAFGIISDSHSSANGSFLVRQCRLADLAVLPNPPNGRKLLL